MALLCALSAAFAAASPLKWPLDLSSPHALGRIAPAHHFSKIRSIDASQRLLGSARCDSSTSPLIRIASYSGADPSGKHDSSEAFIQAMADLIKRGSGKLMADNVTDLGGAVIDLEGGEYLISTPIMIPPMYGNLRFQRGTIRATPSFPSSSYLIEVGSEKCIQGGQGCCNEHIGFENMLLDASLVALGGLRINNTMDTVVGPHMLFIGFQEAGLTIHGGHESTVTHCWFGQYYYDDPRWINGTGKGIWLAGPDSVVTQVVVFSARIGVHVAGWLNAIQQVHTWNLHTPFGGIGIYVTGSSNRFTDNYLDCNAIYLEGVIDTDIQNTFFLAWANIVLAPGPTLDVGPSHQLHGVRIVGSLFEGDDGNASVVVDARNGTFANGVTDSRIERGAARVQPKGHPGRRLVGTTATLSLTKQNTTRFEFDFAERLIFGSIQEVRYSLSLQQGMFARSAARWTAGTAKVAVETDEPVSGTCIVDVDESKRDQW